MDFDVVERLLPGREREKTKTWHAVSGILVLGIIVFVVYVRSIVFELPQTSPLVTSGARPSGVFATELAANLSVLPIAQDHSVYMKFVTDHVYDLERESRYWNCSLDLIVLLFDLDPAN